MRHIEIFKLFGSIYVDNEKANQSIAKTDDKAKKMSLTMGKAMRVVAGFGAGIAIAGGGLLAVSERTAKATDRIDKLSQRLGLSRDGFQEWEFVLSQAGVEIDSMQSGMKKLSQHMQDSVDGTGKGAAIFKELGIQIEEGMSQEEVFNKVIASLQGMEDGITKASLAQDLFGRSGQNLLPLLNSSSASVEELKQKAHELGLVIDGEGVDAGVLFTDTLDQLKRSASSVFTKLGVELLPTAQKFGDWVLGNMPTIQDTAVGAFSFIANTVEKCGKVIGFFVRHQEKLIAVTGSAAVVIGTMKVIGTVTGLMTAWKASTFGQTVAQHGLNAAVKANPIMFIVTAVGAAVAAGIYMYRNWDTVKVNLLATWDVIKISTSNLKEKMTSTWFKMTAKVQELVLKIVKSAEPLTAFLPEQVAESFSNAEAKIEAALEETKKQIDESADNLEDNKKKMAAALDNLKKSFTKSTDGIKEDTTSMDNKITVATENSGNGFRKLGLAAKKTASRIEKAVSRIDTLVSIVDHRYELWKLKNSDLEESAETLTIQLQSQTEKQGLLNSKIAEMELHLEGLKIKYGESGVETLKYTDTILAAKIEQQELANEIKKTSEELDNQLHKMSQLEKVLGKRAVDSKNNDILTYYKAQYYNKQYEEGKPINMYATGTLSAKRGMAIVGEKGMELVNFGGGEKVYNAEKTKSMLKGNITNNINIYGSQNSSPSETARQVKNTLRQLAISW